MFSPIKKIKLGTISYIHIHNYILARTDACNLCIKSAVAESGDCVLSLNLN